jgi:hypothetical protein
MNQTNRISRTAPSPTIRLPQRARIHRCNLRTTHRHIRRACDHTHLRHSHKTSDFRQLRYNRRWRVGMLTLLRSLKRLASEEGACRSRCDEDDEGSDGESDYDRSAAKEWGLVGAEWEEFGKGVWDEFYVFGFVGDAGRTERAVWG